MSVLTPEGTPPPLSQLPATRGLGPVLRRLLEESGSLSLVCGKVLSTGPDAKHVTVELEGQSTVVPCLAGYVPQVGEGAWCLAGRSIVIAIGAASGLRPTTIPGGSATGQVPVWNNTIGAWVPQAQAPSATFATNAGNADTLDALDSAVFLQQILGGTKQVWWGKAVGTAVGGQFSITHPLGRVPSLVLAMSSVAGTAVVQKAEAFAASVNLYVTGGATVDAWVLLIG